MPTDTDDDKLRRIYSSIGPIETGTKPLKSSDFELIGRFIQAFCAADFSARRVISAMRDISGEREFDAGKLNDTAVIEHLEKCGRSWRGGPNIGATAVNAAAIIGMHHWLRHSFAHWVGRRVKNHDALLFLSTSQLHKAPPSHGIKFEPDVPEANAHFRLYTTKHVRTELPKLWEHAQSLGDLATFLEENAAKLKAELPQA